VEVKVLKKRKGVVARRGLKLRQRHIGTILAAQTAGSPHGPLATGPQPALQCAFPIADFDSLGIPWLFEVLWLHRTEPPDADPHVLVVWQGRGSDYSLCRWPKHSHQHRALAPQEGVVGAGGHEKYHRDR